MLEHVFIPRMGDRERVIVLYENLKKSSKAELVEVYNNAVRIGIVVAHAQALRLIAHLTGVLKMCFKSHLLKLKTMYSLV
jgi:hypothetical protein